MKRLIICCDGTWNRPDQEKNGEVCATNVLKLASRIATRDRAGTLQVSFYDQGVGTGNVVDRFSGGAFGRGLEDNILDGYRFLLANYERGDQIYLFGFSRGAYTARSLGGMVRKCGILNRISMPLYNKAVALYRSDDIGPDAAQAVDFRTRNSLCGADPPPIHFVGVWDTVGSLGIPLRGLRWTTRRKYQFHDVQLSRSVRYGYHALAIDERRGPFLPTLWYTSPPEPGVQQTVEQVWFAGVHSDVGGGYKEAGLSDIALGWMMEKALGAGLEFDLEAVTGRPTRPEPLMEEHDSKRRLYAMTPGADREIGVRPADPKDPDGAKQVDPTQSLHPSVIQRWHARPQWRPPALVDYFAKHGAPPAPPQPVSQPARVSSPGSR